MNDRATLDHTAVIRQLTTQLAEMDDTIQRHILLHGPTRIVDVLQMGVWRCQGLVQQLRMAPVGEG